MFVIAEKFVSTLIYNLKFSPLNKNWIIQDSRGVIKIPRNCGYSSINFHFLGPSRRTGVISSQPVATKIILSHHYLPGNEIKRRNGGEAVGLTKYSTANVDPLSGVAARAQKRVKYLSSSSRVF